MDWDNQPIPFKIYKTLPPLLLPREASQTGVAALSAIAQPTLPRDRESIPGLADLTRILYFSAGITKLKKYPGGETFFRAASCTGALYEFELYLVCGDLPDLPSGVYHFSPEDFSLRLLRSGDFRAVLASATAREEAIVQAPVTIICTGTYWRNAWKYRARTYRHFGWDNGTLLSNLLAVSTALGLHSRIVMGFVDSEVNGLLDLDQDREVAFSMVALGHTFTAVDPVQLQLPPLNYDTVQLSEHEVTYPEMQKIHSESSLTSHEEVSHWRTLGPAVMPIGHTEESLEPEAPRDLIEQVILRRASSRSFKRESITQNQLALILRSSTRGIEADFLSSPSEQLNDLYLIVNAVDGLAPGSYFYRRDTGELELLKEGDFRGRAQYLGLQQALPGDASAAIFMLADLKPIFERLGNRGYRAVQMESGIIGGRLYLAAYAQRLGASGLTFFDDAVSDFFSPHAAGKSAIFLVAIGRGMKPGTTG